MGIVPEPDHWVGQLAVVSHCAQARSAQQKRIAVHRRFESDPARGHHTNKMPTGKKQHVSSNVSYAFPYLIGAGHDLSGAFASGGAVAEKLPTWTLRKDLDTAAPLIFAVVPFDKVGFHFRD